ncbi:MAG: IS1595 family transposase [Anaerolineae bacterium]
MTRRQRCPRCRYTRTWVIRRDKRLCARCRYEWRPGLPLRLTRHQWRALLRCHARGLSGTAIAEETGLHRQRVLRALTLLRAAMRREVPSVFQGTVEIDETYLGGFWRNRRSSQRARGRKRGRGTIKTPVFGILCRGGQVWAQVVPDLAAQTLLPLIRRQVRLGSVVCSDTLPTYTGIAAKGYVHRLVQHDQGEFSGRQGAHINGLEGFWGYLKRRLAAKGGIRPTRLPLYVAEYVWRYNHRRLSVDEQVERLMNLLQKRAAAGG